jgi:hypothetical protein
MLKQCLPEDEFHANGTSYTAFFLRLAQCLDLLFFFGLNFSIPNYRKDIYMQFSKWLVIDYKVSTLTINAQNFVLDE